MFNMILLVVEWVCQESSLCGILDIVTMCNGGTENLRGSKDYENKKWSLRWILINRKNGESAKNSSEPSKEKKIQGKLTAVLLFDFLLSRFFWHFVWFELISVTIASGLRSGVIVVAVCASCLSNETDNVSFFVEFGDELSFSIWHFSRWFWNKILFLNLILQVEQFNEFFDRRRRESLSAEEICSWTKFVSSIGSERSLSALVSSIESLKSFSEIFESISIGKAYGSCRFLWQR